LVCGVGGNFTLGVKVVVQTSSSLFNFDGVCTLSLLIKTEGLIAPLTTIYIFYLIRYIKLNQTLKKNKIISSRR